MVFPILPANTLSSGYNIDNSCRFNDGDASYLSDTNLGTPTSTKIGTISFWFKRGSGADSAFISNHSDGDNRIYFRNYGTGQLHIYGKLSGSANITLLTTALYRDPSAWYHIVLSYDTTQVTDTNRMKLYVNGSQVTVFSTGTYPPQDAVIRFNGEDNMNIGRRYAGAYADPIDGYLAEFNFVDGLQLAASNFGETDEDSGIWKPKAPDVSEYGVNGFFLEFKASAVGSGSASTIGADTSGKTNHIDSTNLATTDQCTDTPTNNFCTMNPLDKDEVTVAEGNTETLLAGSDYNGIRGTIAIPNSGKWYYEVKVITLDNDDHSYVGFADGNTDLDAIFADIAGTITYVYDNSGGTSDVYNGSTNVFTGNSTFDAAANDILNVAFDRDNDKVYFGLNGTYAKADGTTGADPSNGTDATCTSVAENTAYTFLPAFGGGDSNAKVQFNFGNPPYANSSSVADANGYGDFEYTPPTGFYALCTKNLAEYG